MSKKRPAITLMMAAALAAVTLTACSSGEAPSEEKEECVPVAEVTTVQPGVLTAVSVESAPLFTYVNNEPGGPNGDLLSKVAEELCLDLQVDLTSVVAATETIKANRADISPAGWYYNDERAETFAISDPIHSDGVGLVSKEGYSNLDEVKDLVVGTTVGVLWSDELQTALGADHVKIYQTEFAVIDDIIAGRIDAGMMAQSMASNRIEEQGLDLKSVLLDPDERISASVDPAVTIALMPKENSALRDAVNKILKEFRDSGELAASLEKVGMDPRAADV